VSGISPVSNLHILLCQECRFDTFDTYLDTRRYSSLQVKRYEVASMNDALANIKNDLGPDAIILSARKIRSGRQEAFEVMAARDENTQLTENILSRTGTVNKARSVDSQEDVFTLFRGELKENRESIDAFQRQNTISRELAEMKETMNFFTEASYFIDT